MKRFYPIFAVIGIFLMVDGVLSIIFQIEEDWMWHEVRIARIIIGILVIHIRNHPIEKGFEFKKGIFRFDSFFLGLILFFDSIISILLQLHEPFIFQIGRYIRLSISIYLMIINFYLIKPASDSDWVTSK